MATGSSDRHGRQTRQSHKAQLAVAYDALSTVLEEVDLERDQEFADMVIAALVETERAYTAAIKAGSQPAHTAAVESED
ncbi:hypothetical protein ACFQJ5_04835 [Halomicroarcula sp. GCM10025324]|jgi:hypothetical protein|uniref:hypothetical protein n=1 Tax=Haloarcula TaxID=2237 RepID=UPI0023E7E4D4|nr:hypothetical protein [Halomicroarcula sp. ZS-22-S1]